MNNEPLFYMCINALCDSQNTKLSISRPVCIHCDKEMISERDVLITKLIINLSDERKEKAMAAFSKMSFEEIKLFKDLYDCAISMSIVKNRITLHEFPVGGIKTQ